MGGGQLNLPDGVPRGHGSGEFVVCLRQPAQ